MQTKNIKQLREDLARVYDNIENKKIGLNMAKEKANLAGKMINTVKCELEYQVLMGVKKPIEFLEVD